MDAQVTSPGGLDGTARREALSLGALSDVASSSENTSGANQSDLGMHEGRFRLGAILKAVWAASGSDDDRNKLREMFKASDRDGKTVLMTAVDSRVTIAVEEFLEVAEDILTGFEVCTLITTQDDNGDTPLSKAMRSDHTLEAVLKAIGNCGKDLVHKVFMSGGFKGSNVLITAATQSYNQGAFGDVLAAAQHLLTDAHVYGLMDENSDDGDTFLSKAVTHGNHEILGSVLAVVRRRDPNNEKTENMFKKIGCDGSTVLMKAAGIKDKTIYAAVFMAAKEILQPAQLHHLLRTRDSDGNTVLEVAEHTKNEDMIHAVKETIREFDSDLAQDQGGREVLSPVVQTDNSGLAPPVLPTTKENLRGSEPDVPRGDMCLQRETDGSAAGPPDEENALGNKASTVIPAQASYTGNSQPPKESPGNNSATSKVEILARDQDDFQKAMYKAEQDGQRVWGSYEQKNSEKLGSDFDSMVNARIKFLRDKLANENQRHSDVIYMYRGTKDRGGGHQTEEDLLNLGVTLRDPDADDSLTPRCDNDKISWEALLEKAGDTERRELAEKTRNELIIATQTLRRTTNTLLRELGSTPNAATPKEISSKQPSKSWLPAYRGHWISPAFLLYFLAFIALGTLVGVRISIAHREFDDNSPLSNNKGLTIVVYSLVIIPIGLFQLHDVIDKRWRLVTAIHRFSRLYAIMSFLGLSFLTAYAVVQFFGGVVDEGMAAAVTCSIAVYGGVLHLRQREILRFFDGTLQEAARNIHMHCVQKRENTDRLSSKESDSGTPGGFCYNMLSSSLCDDNYPGEGPRVTWLASTPVVVDKLEFVARAGLWICLAAAPSTSWFTRELGPKTQYKTTVDPASKKALWTLDVARLLFDALGETECDIDTFTTTCPLQDLKDLVLQLENQKVDVRKWAESLRLVPSIEWAQVLAEYSSIHVVGLAEATIAWEILLALCSPNMKAVLNDEQAVRRDGSRKEGVRERMSYLTRQFGWLEPAKAYRVEKFFTTADCLELENLSKQWAYMLRQLCVESSRREGVLDKQFEMQVQRSQEMDMLVAIALKVYNIPPSHLEFDCGPALAEHNSTRLLQQREKHVLDAVTRHLRGDSKLDEDRLVNEPEQKPVATLKTRRMSRGGAEEQKGDT